MHRSVCAESHCHPLTHRSAAAQLSLAPYSSKLPYTPIRGCGAPASSSAAAQLGLGTFQGDQWVVSGVGGNDLKHTYNKSPPSLSAPRADPARGPRPRLRFAFALISLEGCLQPFAATENEHFNPSLKTLTSLISLFTPKNAFSNHAALLNAFLFPLSLKCTQFVVFYISRKKGRKKSQNKPKGSLPKTILVVAPGQHLSPSCKAQRGVWSLPLYQELQKSGFCGKENNKQTPEQAEKLHPWERAGSHLVIQQIVLVGSRGGGIYIYITN